MLKRPRGGLWLELKKLPAAQRPIAELKAPIRLFLPLRQFKGAVPKVCVNVGDSVLMGQPVAVAAEGLSNTLHSPVSGAVSAIAEYDHPIGGHSHMIVIENDGRDLNYIKSFTPLSVKSGREEIIEAVKNSGIVSAAELCAPLWVKLSGAAGKKVKTVVINAVEAEPYICSSQKIIEESPDSVAGGLSIIMKCLGATSAIIAVSDDIPSEIVDGMVAGAKLEGIVLKVAHIPQKYPLGIEYFLMRELFAHEIENAPVQLRKFAPEDMHVSFFCAEDCFNVSRAASQGQPQVTRIITVAGDAVQNPQNLEVRIGTTVRDVLDFCGLKFEPDRIVLGSAMRGVAVTDLNTPITKSVTAVLALKAVHAGFSKSICINCGKCANVCPQGLLPNYIAMRAVKADFDSLRELHISDCIECGSCAYICPGRMPIVELIKNIKKAAQ